MKWDPALPAALHALLEAPTAVDELQHKVGPGIGGVAVRLGPVGGQPAEGLRNLIGTFVLLEDHVGSDQEDQFRQRTSSSTRAQYYFSIRPCCHSCIQHPDEIHDARHIHGPKVVAVSIIHDFWRQTEAFEGSSKANL